MSTLKAQLRQEALAALRQLMAEEKRVWSDQIHRELASWPEWKSASCVLLYAPLKNEPDLLPLLETNPQQRPRLCFPRVHAVGMDFWEVTEAAHLVPGTTLLRGPEITRCRPVSIEEIELTLLPGLAFDPATGMRLGRGGGYYDRLLADPKFHARTMGVCFSSQIRQGLPAEPHDIPVQFLLTERGCERIGQVQ